MCYIAQRAFWYCHNARALDWRAYLGMAVLGFIYGLDKPSESVNCYVFMRFMFSTLLYLALTFSINNCFDVECDRRRREKHRKNPIALGLISLKEGLILSSCIASVGLVLTRVWFDDVIFLLYASLVLLGVAYSAPPLRLKSVPVIDLVSHGSFFGSLLFLYGVLVIGSPGPKATLVGVSIFVYSVILELRNHIEDFELDRASAIKTTACWLGLARARGLLRILLALHWSLLITVSWIAGPWSAFATLGLVTAVVKTLRSRFDHLRITDVSSCIVYASSALPHLMQALAVWVES
ncbi:TPA: hypothetical protein EYP44_03510 [Candidatus Bathyarchaeota archaeon]|nr:hypothetical protein [Candidatus Bathyarchaeota archaeon]